MSEMIWTVVQMRVPESWNGEPTLVDPRWARTPGQTEPTMPPVLAAIVGDNPHAGYYWEEISHDPEHNVWTAAGSQNYGLIAIDDMLGELRQLRVPYRAHDETKYEFGGETQVYDGNEAGDVDQFPNGGNDSGIVMHPSTWEGIVSSRGGFPNDSIPSLIGMVNDVRAFFGRDRSIEELSIDHLPANPPSVDEDGDDETDNQQMETSTC